jgi:hypothetical protein
MAFIDLLEMACYLLYKALAAQNNWWHIVWFSLYVALCYWAIIWGHVYVDKICYKKLYEGKDIFLKDKDPITINYDSHTPPNIIGIRCGQTEFPSKSPKGIWGLLIIFIFCCFLLLEFCLPQGFLRGFLCLFIFAIITILTNAAMRSLSGLGFRPTMTIMGISIFYGALFWWIDSFTPAAAFNSLLDEINTGTNKLEGLKLLYDYTKNYIILIISLFVSICVTLVWNICSRIEDKYNKVGLTQILTLWMVWLTFWFSFGLLAIMGSGLGKRMSAILNSLK